MAKGKTKSNYLGREGIVMYQTQPSWDFIYETSLIKHPKYNLGDRIVLPDGRVFRYAKTGAANYDMNNDYAVRFGAVIGQQYTEVKTSTVIGAKEVTITADAHLGFAEDELRGGYVIVYRDGGGGNTQFRGIIGNPVVAAATDFTIYLDGGLDKATVGGTTGIEVWNNPYKGLVKASGVAINGFAGKPAVQITTALTYFWVQTWGPCWLAHDSAVSPFTRDNQRACFTNLGAYTADYGYTNTMTAAGYCNQIAGFTMLQTAGPFLCLTVNP